MLWRSSLADMPLKGEVVLLIGKSEASPDPDKVELALREALKTRQISRDAASDVASRFGMSRRDIYQLGIKIGG